MSQADGASGVSDSVETFRLRRPTYERFAAYVSTLVSGYCRRELIHTTQYRAKTADSFAKKCLKESKPGVRTYSTPLSEITDLAGVRVIVFVRESVDIVCREIGNILQVTETEDVGDRVFNQGKFGYQSKHLLVKLGPDRKRLIENAEFNDYVCEIQVRTILQHAWAEMEHDIQYKRDSGLPLDLQKRFSALAGLLEIADREFQSIQYDSDNLKRVVKEELISDLTQQSLQAGRENAPDGEGGEQQAVAARNLISQRRYPEAIDIYTTKIMAQPLAHTLFIGRAKAKFLAGDVNGSIADLDEAERLSGQPESTTRLRGIIERGDDPNTLLTPPQGNSQYRPGVQKAMDAIRAGDGVGGFEEYGALDAAGYNKGSSLFGKAMCCVLENDSRGAREFLGSLQIFQGSPMAINIWALFGLLKAIDGEPYDEERASIVGAMNDLPTFSFELSPLKQLREGLKVRDKDKYARAEPVFRLLSHPVGGRLAN